MIETEARKRIEFLNTGPWIAKGKRAWRVIGERPQAPPMVKEKQRELRNLLRSHWEKEIIYDEGVVRDSFDEALTVYQLYELAIETGYISFEDVRDQVHRELGSLLWSDGARHYLHHYSYSAVAYLAQRVGLDLGYKEVSQLPPVREGAEGRFASFLSQHALWYKDKVLDGWIGFLDDYQVLNDAEDTDKEIFLSFLTTSSKKFDKEAKLWNFVSGADRLLMRLAGLAESLSDSEKPSYGMFYAYWMAKLYGYDLGKNGFFRDKKQVDWPAELLKSKRIAYQLDELRKPEARLPDGIDPQSAITLFEQRDKTVRDFWAITRKQFETDPIQFR